MALRFPITPFGLAMLALLAACGSRGGEQAAENVAIPPEQVRARLIGLPDGGTITAAPGSVGEKLADYLASTDPAPRSFEFGGTQFADWSPTATPATRGSVPTLALLLRAYPEVKIRLIGHSDGAGDPAENLKISAERAEVAKAALVEAGVSESRIETEGAGMARPIADNATVEGRARNRRVELVVTAK